MQEEMIHDVAMGEGRRFRFDGRIWGLIAVLGILVGAVFARSLSTQFVDLDDKAYVFDNPHVIGPAGGLSWENVKWAFTMDDRVGYWIPVTYLSLELDGSLTDQKKTLPMEHPERRLAGAPAPLVEATAFKAQNIFWHGVATVFLFLFLFRATGNKWAAFAVAALWAIHPLRVESVVWVSERKDVLAGAWGFFTMYLYVGWKERGGWWRYAGVCGAFAVSLMAKPMCVTLPAVLVLVDGWPLGRIKSMRDVWKSLGEKWSLLALSVGASVVAVVSQARGNAVNPLSNIPLGLRLENSLVSYVMYGVRHVRVWDLVMYYTYDRQLPWWEASGAGLALLGVTYACFGQRARRPWLLMGWLWFLGSMLPMIGILLVGEQAYADRFSYLPAVGLFVMGVFTVASLRAEVRGRAGMAAGILLGIFFAGFSVIQIGYWSDSISILSRTDALTHNNYVCENALANAYLRQGNNEAAEDAFTRSAEGNPTSEGGWMNIGWLHYQTGNFAKSAPEFYQAFKIMPRNEEALRLYGESLGALGKLESALTVFKLCVQAKPEDKVAAEDLRMAQEELGKERAATQQGVGPGEMIRP